MKFLQHFAGEFIAFLTGANLIIDYVLSNAAVARSFTTYFATGIGISTETHLRITVNGLPKGFNEIDLVAVALVLILTIVICYRLASEPQNHSTNFFLEFLPVH